MDNEKHKGKINIKDKINIKYAINLMNIYQDAYNRQTKDCTLTDRQIYNEEDSSDNIKIFDTREEAVHMIDNIYFNDAPYLYIIEIEEY